jgi:hypothetical protein
MLSTVEALGHFVKAPLVFTMAATRPGENETVFWALELRLVDAIDKPVPGLVWQVVPALEMSAHAGCDWCGTPAVDIESIQLWAAATML